jgi:hypothetical protein
MWKSLTRFGRSLKGDSLKHYVPIDAFREEQVLRARWLKATNKDFREPFYSATVARIIRSDLRDTFKETTLEAALGYGKRGRAPDGFIYHISRCGSTLLGNMLRAVPGSIVMSEPSFPLKLLGDVAENPSDYAERDCIDMIRASICSLGVEIDTNTKLFVKWGSTNVLQIDMIRKAFPGVQEVFLYRDPAEVIVSNMRHPWQGWMWNPNVVGVGSLAECVEMSPVEACARALGRKLAIMSRSVNERTYIMKYCDISASAENICSHLGVPLNHEVISTMNATLSYDAKDMSGKKPFKSDVGERRAAITPLIRSAAEEYAGKQFAELEDLELRRAKSYLTADWGDQGRQAQ